MSVSRRARGGDGPGDPGPLGLRAGALPVPGPAGLDRPQRRRLAADALSLLLAALAAGAVILFPSLGYLFRVFKAHKFAERLGGRGTARDR